jgi:hypothetical protein
LSDDEPVIISAPASRKRTAPASRAPSKKKPKKAVQFVPVGASANWIDAPDPGKMITRPPDSLVSKAVRLSIDVDDPTRRPFFRCSAYDKGCRHTLADPAQRGRVFKHAAVCKLLPRKLMLEALSKLSSGSISAQAEAFESPSSSPSSSTPSTPPHPLSGQSTIYIMARNQGIKKTQLLASKELIYWMCTAGEAGRTLDNPHFRKMIGLLNAKFHSPLSTTYEDTLLPQECAWVEQQALKYLRTLTHLSISFDAGTITNGKSNIHCTITTEDGRQFMFEGKDGSAFSHTGEYYYQFLREVS